MMLDIQHLNGGDAPVNTTNCYLSGAAYRLGARRRTAASLMGLDAFFAANGLPADLGLLGMGHFHETDDAVHLALAAARESLASVEGEVDAVILCGSRFLGETADHAVAMHRLLAGLGLAPAFTAGVTMNRCASFLSGPHLPRGHRRSLRHRCRAASALRAVLRRRSGLHRRRRAGPRFGLPHRRQRRSDRSRRRV
jgi:3-oxoacyl-[acyl-carrier-protein] synthase-3